MAENQYHQEYQKTLTLIQDNGCKNAINIIKSKTIFLRIVCIGNFYTHMHKQGCRTSGKCILNYHIFNDVMSILSNMRVIKNRICQLSLKMTLPLVHCQMSFPLKQSSLKQRTTSNSFWHLWNDNGSVQWFCLKFTLI